MAQTYQITGNVGITSSQGAVTVTLRPANAQSPSTSVRTNNDTSGDYKFTGLSAGRYIVSADASAISSGAFVNYIYRHPQMVDIGTSDVAAVNLTPSAMNASNAGYPV